MGLNHGYPYAPFYCDENVWQFLNLPSDHARWAVIVTNPGKAVALWCQRSAPVPGEIVVWDYHVVALEKTDEGYLLYDHDCYEGCPLSASQWTETTFPSDRILVSSEPPQFRVVEATEFLRDYKSDRRHMSLNPAPHPPWPPIDGGESTLEAFLISGEGGGPGRVMSEVEWRTLVGP